MTATTRIPTATLQEEWRSAYVGWTRTPHVPAEQPVAAPAPAGRSARLTEALLRLAADPRATPAERASAAQKAADLLHRVA